MRLIIVDFHLFLIYSSGIHRYRPDIMDNVVSNSVNSDLFTSVDNSSIILFYRIYLVHIQTSLEGYKRHAFVGG